MFENMKWFHKVAKFMKKSEKVELDLSQPAFTCLKLTTETVEQGMIYVQS